MSTVAGSLTPSARHVPAARTLVLVCLVVLAGVAPVSAAAAAPATHASAASSSTHASTSSTSLSTHASTLSTSLSTHTSKSSTSAATSTDAAEAIQRTVVLDRTPGDTERFRARVEHRIPADVESLSLQVPARATVVRTDGFRKDREADDGDWYEWTGGSRSPSLVLSLPSDERTTVRRAAQDESGLTFVETEGWALVRVPGFSTRWRSIHTGSVDTSVSVDGSGATGGAIAFLGEYTERRREAGGQTLRLIVPAAADLDAPGTVLDTVGKAAETLDVGARDERVFMIAAPTDGVDWAVGGIQTGDADMWVRDSASLDDPDSIWLHEYVHTRQNYRPAASAQWTVEATADYYAALLALRQDRIDFRQFRLFLARGQEPRYADAVLADPGTWSNDAVPYRKGALVAGDLDRRIREATDSRGSLAGVVRRLNRHDGEVTAAIVRAAVADVAGDATASATDRYVETEATPSPWDAETHSAVFGTVPAAFVYRLAGGATVAGPYRNATLDASSVSVVPGERVAVNATVENTGGSAGTYNATLVAGGRVVDARNGTLPAGESTTVALAHRFVEPGEYTLSVGGDTLRVTAREPASPSVTDLSVSPRAVSPGENVTVSATVRNDADSPGERNLTITAGERTVATRPVRLDAGESLTVTATVSFDAPGEYTVAAGDASATVSVRAPTTRETDASAGSGPGFGVAATLVAGVLALGLRRL
ncbi:hypothetical protein BRC83_06710 [Halobacteriales archaeon QS_1_68_17]|nr:MAG: hypothetical protein BRC83_06710 [Halobacteriales archaeon QS_1_68_17]